MPVVSVARIQGVFYANANFSKLGRNTGVKKRVEYVFGKPKYGKYELRARILYFFLQYPGDFVSNSRDTNFQLAVN